MRKRARKRNINIKIQLEEDIENFSMDLFSQGVKNANKTHEM